MTNKWRMTNTAIVHLEEIVERTAFRWGYEQAFKYHNLLRIGFQEIADRYKSFKNPHRAQLAEGTDFEIHLVEHHYVVFKICNDQSIIIAGIFHEKMDIPIHLRSLQRMDKREISNIEDEIFHKGS